VQAPLPDRRWTRDGHEPRIRTITFENGECRAVLTFKSPPWIERAAAK
jgi:hypothetical protein